MSVLSIQVALGLLSAGDVAGVAEELTGRFLKFESIEIVTCGYTRVEQKFKM